MNVYVTNIPVENYKNLKLGISISKNNTKIINSHVLSNNEIEKLVKIIFRERKRLGYIITRTKTSYKKEVIVHNRLYKFGIFRKRTKDTDIEEPINKILEILYFIFGIEFNKGGDVIVANRSTRYFNIHKLMSYEKINIIIRKKEIKNGRKRNY